MQFDDFQADPIAEVRRIYARFGFELSAPAETAMRDWIARNRKGRHGAHAYSAQDYGLSEAEIERRFEQR
jgi:hypothetical protein